MHQSPGKLFILQDFLRFWVTIYKAFPETIRLDRESSFTSENFRNQAKDVGVA